MERQTDARDSDVGGDVMVFVAANVLLPGGILLAMAFGGDSLDDSAMRAMAE